MSSERNFHKAQVRILETLLYATRARYSELMRAADLDSDIFKFHIKKLQKLGLVLKVEDGSYELTPEGKMVTSRLDTKTGSQIEQPKSSTLLVVRCGGLVLAHRRTREPFNGFWGVASAPVIRGLPLAESASRQLKAQTGIEAEFRVAGMHRVIDKNRRGVVLEDKIFSVMLADMDETIEPKRWTGGDSHWMSRNELISKAKLFPTTKSVLDMLDAGISFREDSYVYSEADY